ncbi:MAG: poly-gamma-glutamate synthesis protein (capsule biosynthesis protein) [Parcubacteria group bacterium Gr01-1014_29]|nr:MAG: poly-gamma-glutamate synthesis protein (capsule biosynthesis protein) [Parcubacteria group bacterium Gr01-1014_29]
MLVSGGALVSIPFILTDYITTPSALSFESQKTPNGAESGVLASSDIVAVADTSLMQNRAEIYQTRTLESLSFSVPKTGRAIFADLAEMMLRVYRDGAEISAYPILSKGKPGSLWETPTGVYAVKTKEENHFSTIGEVWMPHSLQFFGNFFIHGWPHYFDGRPVPEGFSGGCIRLSAQDAEQVFKAVDIGVPVYVTNGALPAVLAATDAPEEEQFGYRGRESFTPPPALSGEAAIVGDLENGFLFFEKNQDTARSLASLSKLMTALISVETVNQFHTATITEEDVEIYGDAGGLHAGDRFEVGELLWPLLLTSSNDAAHAIARQIGAKQFVRLMNEKAASLGLGNTLFVEPSGLDPANTSTAIDTFRLVQYLWSNKRSLLEMTEKRSYKTWRNIHPFVSKSTFLGGKTGYIPEAKRTIVSVFSMPFGEFGKRSIAVVVLGSDAIQSDVERLRIWAKNNFMYDLQLPQENQRIEYAARDLSNPSSALSLLFTGDIMLNRGVKAVIQKNGGDWSFPFAHVAEVIKSADITFGNMEGPASDVGENVGSVYSFRMDPRVPEAFASAGFDVVSLANNHMGDWGRTAFEDTMRRLRRAGVAYAGAGWNSAEILKPTVEERNGMRVGYLAFSDVGPGFLRAGEALSGIAVVPAGNQGLSYVEKAVLQASRDVDILVVSFHFGEEYEPLPTLRQRALSRIAIDAGARVVIGHHPHVVQSVEEYGGGVIAYSLGNFVFDQNFSPETMEGLMLKVEFQGKDITAVIPIPIKMNEFYQPEVE